MVRRRSTFGQNCGALVELCGVMLVDRVPGCKLVFRTVHLTGLRLLVIAMNQPLGIFFCHVRLKALIGHRSL